MKKNLTKMMLVALMAILPLSFYAQKRQSMPVERYFYLSGEGGLSVNHTDLANYGFIPFIQDLNHDGQTEFVFNDGYVFKNFDAKLGLGYQFSKVVGVNAKFGFGTLSGEHWDAAANLVAGTWPVINYLQLNKTQFLEGNLNLTFNFSNLFFGYNPRRVFNFIPHVGIGGIFYKAGEVMDLTSGTTTTAAKLPALTSYAKTYTIPFGAELNFNLGRRLDLFLDYTYTLNGADDLDQTHKLNELDNIINRNDMYSSFNLGLRYKFNKGTGDIDKMAANAGQITYTVNPDPLTEKDGKVCFDVVFDIPAEYFEKDAVMNITPTLNYNGGSIDLEPVTFVGEKVKGQGDFVVNYKRGGQFTKNYCLDYVPEMENSTLNVNPMFYIYNGTIYGTQDEIVQNVYYTQGGNRKIADGVVYTTVITCEVTNIRTTVDGSNVTVSWNGDAESYDIYFGVDAAFNNLATVTGVKGNSYTFTDVEPGNYFVFVKANCKDNHFGEWQQSAANVEIVAPKVPVCIFYFDYNSSVLKPNTKLNKQAVMALVERLASGEMISGFEIQAWASPEGELQLNNNLADERAAAADKAIRRQLKKMKLNEKNFNFVVNGNGPDWDKFMELVAASNIKDKDQILRVIKNSSNREQEIKNMINVYPELERDILPLIRRAEVYFN